MANDNETVTTGLPKALKYVRTHTPYKGKPGMSLQDLAIESGLSTSYISQLENPARLKTPSKKALDQLAKGLTVATSLDSSVMLGFLKSMAGYMRPSSETALSVSRTLTSTEYEAFLEKIVFCGQATRLKNLLRDFQVNTYVEPRKNEFNNFGDIDNLIDAHNESMASKLDELDNVLSVDLNRIEVKDIEVLLDSQKLSSTELVILRNAIKTIRDLRNS